VQCTTLIAFLLACADSGRTIADLDTPGQRVLVAQGGKGGSMFTVDYQPTKGEHRAVKLVLKSIADIGLVGYAWARHRMDNVLGWTMS
jgi:GTPase involved in cell partitioning and DNA repair